MPISIISTGSALPGLAVTNGQLEKLVDTSDEWIYSRTGIRERRIAVTETTLSLGIAAARDAMEAGDISPSEIGLVICATITPDGMVPGMAAGIRHALGIGPCPAMDINAACTGFLYGLCTANGLMETMGIRTALVVGSETLSKVTDWADRGTCILFGDGAGAAILRKTEKPGLLAAHLEGIDDADEALYCRSASPENPFSAAVEEDGRVHMNGRRVFTFAVGALIETIEETLKRANVTVDELKMIVPHQANIRIISSTAQRMGIPMDKFYLNLEKTGNTSAASVPIALDELAKSGLLEPGDLVLLAGFGGGLTYGSALIRWN